MSKPHWDGHSEWNQKSMASGVHPNSSPATYHGATGCTDSFSSGRQDGGYYPERAEQPTTPRAVDVNKCHFLPTSSQVFWGCS